MGETVGGCPIFTEHEIECIKQYVHNGGALLIVSEYENDKYGNNLNDLISGMGVQITNDTASCEIDCKENNKTWVFGHRSSEANIDLLYKVDRACFYRSGICEVDNRKACLVVTKSSIGGSNALVAGVTYGKGHVLVICDSDVFGDEYINEFDNKRFFRNCLEWLFISSSKIVEDAVQKISSALIPYESLWNNLKECAEEIRKDQNSDGSITTPTDKHYSILDQLIFQIDKLSTLESYNHDYYDELKKDLLGWKESNFSAPNFSRSAKRWSPQENRTDGRIHSIIFPMYTPNASNDTKLESLQLRIYWPDWLSSLEQKYINKGIVPGGLLRHSSGYDSECAVLFPEMIPGEGITNHYGIIFCNKEAKRFINYIGKVAKIVNLVLPANVNLMLSSEIITTEVYMHWDLVHDHMHSRGHLPYDPFMVRRKMPYWMYALEELRVDVMTYMDMMSDDDLETRNEYVQVAIVLDRLLRFPLTQTRTRDYDGLAGQVLFGFLYGKEIINWCDKTLNINWQELDTAILKLNEELGSLYRKGANESLEAQWDNCYDFISQYVTPVLGSNWKNAVQSAASSPEGVKKFLLESVHADEFPLNVFYENVRSRLSELQ